MSFRWSEKKNFSHVVLFNQVSRVLCKGRQAGLLRVKQCTDAVELSGRTGRVFLSPMSHPSTFWNMIVSHEYHFHACTPLKECYASMTEQLFLKSNKASKMRNTIGYVAKLNY